MKRYLLNKPSLDEYIPMLLIIPNTNKRDPIYSWVLSTKRNTVMHHIMLNLTKNRVERLKHAFQMNHKHQNENPNNKWYRHKTAVCCVTSNYNFTLMGKKLRKIQGVRHNGAEAEMLKELKTTGATVMLPDVAFGLIDVEVKDYLDKMTKHCLSVD